MIQTLIRDEQTSEGALGKLYIDGDYFCETLQPDETDSHFHIPAGTYICKRFHGAKWNDTFEINREGESGVDGHHYLLFHSGNTEDDTEGCILLGSERGKLKGNRAVLNSGTTFKNWLARTEDVDQFTLIIEDNYFPGPVGMV